MAEVNNQSDSAEEKQKAADAKSKETQSSEVNAEAQADSQAATQAEGQTSGEEASSEQSSGEEASPRRQPKNLTRRALCIGLGSTAALLGIGALRYVGHTPVNRPPGGQDESHLVSACIRCERCYEACPRHVIVPAHVENGILGVRSPQLNFDNDYCDFCQQENDGVPLCVSHCPTNALNLPAGATQQTTIIGLAVLDPSTCLAYHDTGCQLCYDACPYNAIELQGGGNRPHPAVIPENCNGCGACESVCISLKSGSLGEGATERAIKVRPLATLN